MEKCRTTSSRNILAHQGSLGTKLIFVLKITAYRPSSEGFFFSFQLNKIYEVCIDCYVANLVCNLIGTLLYAIWDAKQQFFMAMLQYDSVSLGESRS